MARRCVKYITLIITMLTEMQLVGGIELVGYNTPSINHSPQLNQCLAV